MTNPWLSLIKKRGALHPPSEKKGATPTSSSIFSRIMDLRKTGDPLPLEGASSHRWLGCNNGSKLMVPQQGSYITIHIVMYTNMYIRVYIYIHTYIHTLHYITLHYITLHYITLHYITLHYITLHYITLHYITLHNIT